jgi:glycine/D-amino acid oxidase-like deaminating enzyme/nitrite reductase/ring-hydroxylating ferredoxin subunit
MNVGDERSRSLWMDIEVADNAPALDRAEHADTVVIGAGIAGLSTAYELAAAGQSVVVLDRGAIGKGMTARTTAHLVSITDDSTDSMIKMRGLETARLFFQSQSAAIDRIESIQQRESIGCNFRRLSGYLFPGPHTDLAILDREFEACRRIGVDVADTVGLPFARHQDTRCLRVGKLGTFHPLMYLRGLGSAICRMNGRLYAHTCVTSIEEHEDGVLVRTVSGHDVRADAAVVATNSPINDRVAIHTKQAPYRTYAMAFTVPRASLEDGLYWDTLDPYHYVRLEPGRGSYDYLIVGGADHKTGQADDAAIRFQALEAWARNMVPRLGKETHRWSGQIMDTMDYAGFIGRNPGTDNVYVATGDSGQGITHGVVSGSLNSALILKGENPWSEVYDPGRKTVRALGNFLSENVTMVENFAQYVAPGEVKSLDDVKPGHGAIVRQGAHKIAAFRAENGRLLLRSASCTHVGCHLQWNSFERCWDCPCHGSHFAPDGEALNAPAVSALAEVAAVDVGKRKPRRKAG